MSINPSIPEIHNFLNFTLKIHGEGEMTMICILQSLDTICANFDIFFIHGQAHLGKCANNHDSAQLQD